MVAMQLAIDDVADDRLRQQLLETLDRLDEAHDSLKWSLYDIVTYDVFDSLRVIAADLREDERAAAAS